MKGYNRVIAKQTVLAALVLLTLNWVGPEFTPGWATWAATLPAWLIIAITTLARVKDITAVGKNWFFRRISLTLAGAGSTALAVAPLIGYSNAFPSWYTVLTFWGVAGLLLTSPHQPPWWKYISGEWRLKKGQQA